MKTQRQSTTGASSTSCLHGLVTQKHKMSFHFNKHFRNIKIAQQQSADMLQNPNLKASVAGLQTHAVSFWVDFNVFKHIFAAVLLCFQLFLSNKSCYWSSVSSFSSSFSHVLFSDHFMPLNVLLHLLGFEVSMNSSLMFGMLSPSLPSSSCFIVSHHILYLCYVHSLSSLPSLHSISFLSKPFLPCSFIQKRREKLW